MNSRSRHLAVLFADLGGSTQLYEERGDEEARRITAQCIERMIEHVREHGGRLVKTIGDEVMAAFPTGDAGLGAAEAIAVEQGEGPSPMGVHVGLHAGPVIEEHGDVFGDTVNVAARLVGLAVNGEVLTSGAVQGEASPEWRARLRPFDRRTVDGKRREIEVYSLVRATPEMTVVQPIPQALRTGSVRLVLRYADRSYAVDEDHPSLSVGRSAENDLVLPDPWVSRRHARIKLRRGKYVLCDESSNGTWVRRRGGHAMRLHREEMILPSAGELGARPAPDVEIDLPVSFEMLEGPAA